MQHSPVTRYIDATSLAGEPPIQSDRGQGSVRRSELALVRGVRRELRRLGLHVPWLSARLKETEPARTALDLVYDGFAPVLLIDGQRVDVIADVLVGVLLSDGRAFREPLVVVPLVRILEEALGRSRGDLARQVRAVAAPKLWRRDDAGAGWTEYEILRAGPRGVELIGDRACGRG